jgi:hypothetical protein
MLTETTLTNEVIGSAIRCIANSALGFCLGDRRRPRNFWLSTCQVSNQTSLFVPQGQICRFGPDVRSLDCRI